MHLLRPLASGALSDDECPEPHECFHTRPQEPLPGSACKLTLQGVHTPPVYPTWTRQLSWWVSRGVYGILSLLTVELPSKEKPVSCHCFLPGLPHGSLPCPLRSAADGSSGALPSWFGCLTHGHGCPQDFPPICLTSFPAFGDTLGSEKEKILVKALYNLEWKLAFALLDAKEL